MRSELKKTYEALVNDEFFVEYLPVMRIDGKECLGAEALIRWKQAQEIIGSLVISGVFVATLTYASIYSGAA